MRILILTFGTKRHGEVIVKYRNPTISLTKDAIETLAKTLIASYRTPGKGIPLQEFRRAKYVDVARNPLR